MARLGEVAVQSAASRVLLLLFGLTAAASGACTTNHDALARQPHAGTGGSAGTGGGGTGGTGLVGTGNTDDQTDQGGRLNPDDEPKGDNVLTIVNGVIDAQSMRLCFAHVDSDGQTSDFAGDPLPELGYAESTVLTQLDGFSLADDVIQPWAIAGDLSLIEKLDCTAAVALAQSEEAKVTPAAPGSGGQGNAGGAGAGGDVTASVGGAGGSDEQPAELPALRARPMAALPAGTVNIGRSILMVVTGCLGGAAYRDKIDTSACGADYTPDTPTLAPLVVKMSRIVHFDKVGLQGVHGSLATAPVDVRVSGDKGAVSLAIATSLAYGAIEPRPANVQFGPDEIGVGLSNYGLQAVDAGGGILYQDDWVHLLKASGLAPMVADRNYTAIFLGPDPLLIKIGWWNKSAFALVDSDPTRKD